MFGLNCGRASPARQDTETADASLFAAPNVFACATSLRPISASRHWRVQRRAQAGERAEMFDAVANCRFHDVRDEIRVGAITIAMPRGVHLMSNADNARPHIPVMLPEVLRAARLEPGEIVVDATFGAGGYTRAFLETGASVLAIDRDPDAIAAGQALVEDSGGHLRLEQGRFSNLDAIAKSCGHQSVDAVVADIGVSSMQIDQAERGFSFQKDGPLDMRMEQAGVSAADVVNTFKRGDLTRVIGILGEERQASRISAEIVAQREKQPFETTLQLAKCIEKVLGRKPGDKIHPATRTFQALRIFVNGELEQLADALLAAERILKPGGRLVVVTFHSLEDRLVKRFFQDRAEHTTGSRHLPQVDEKALTFRQIKRGAVSASADEAAENPRARSAKLRSAIRTEEAPRDADRSIFGLPRLAQADPSQGGAA